LLLGAEWWGRREDEGFRGGQERVRAGEGKKEKYEEKEKESTRR
jgi:hypothetical protein